MPSSRIPLRMVNSPGSFGVRAEVVGIVKSQQAVVLVAWRTGSR